MTPDSPRAPLPAMSLIGGFYLVYLASCLHLLFVTQTDPRPHVMTVSESLPQADWAQLWYAGKLLFIRSANRFGVLLTVPPSLAQTFTVNLISPNAPFSMVWAYPPPMGLMVMPFSLIPLAPSFWIWRLFSIAAAGILLRRCGLRWPIVLAGLASPAALQDLLGGQDGTLTGSILTGCLLLVDASPAWAGCLAGLLCIKPQIGIGLAAVLINRRRVMLPTCLGVAIALIILSALIEGWQAWVFFFNIARPDEVRAAAASFSQSFPAAAITVFYLVRSLHGSVEMAWTAQSISSIASLLLIWRLWHRDRPGDPAARMAATVCLSVLASPHGFAYDLVAFSIGMAMMFERRSGWPQLAFGLLWLFGGYTVTFMNITQIAIMPLMAAAGTGLVWRHLGPAGPHDEFTPIPANGQGM